MQHANPRLSWRFQGDADDWKQASYEVKVHRQGKVEEYKVDSGDNVTVPWPSAPLVSREAVRVKVRSVGTNGQNTAWKGLDLETALLDKSDWTARMITGEDQPADAPKRPFLFTTAFNVQDTSKPARLYATAWGIYEAEINGQRIGDHLFAPGWQAYAHRLHYQVYDIAPMLQKGHNNIGVHVAEGWYAGRLGFGGGRRDLYGDHVAFLGQIEIDGKVVAATGPDWKWSYGPLETAELYDGEVFDSRKDATMFDGPWHPVNTLGLPTAALVAPEAEPVRKTEEVAPKEIITTPSGKIIIDFGQNLVGYLRINRNPQVAAGKTITLRHAEVLEHGELGVRPLRHAKATDIITTGGDLTNWTPHFTFHGFRYAEIAGYPNLSLDSFTAIVIHTDMERLGHFECSHKEINQLHRNVTWGLRGNFLSVPTDCPQRDERLGWTGDIQAFAPSAAFLYDVSGILGNWLDDLAIEQKHDQGGIPALVVPNILQKINMGPLMPQAVWADVAVLTPHDLYTAYGDVRQLRDQYESMTQWLQNIDRDPKTQLWVQDKFQLADWLDPKAPPDAPGDARTDNVLVADAYLVHVTQITSKIAALVGDAPSAETFGNQYQRLRQAFRDEYVTKSGRLVSDSQTAFALALRFGLFEGSEKAHAIQRLGFLIRKEKFRIGTGFAGTPVILHALAENGLLNHAYRMLQEGGCPSWLFPVTMGATTVWERWDSMLPDGSINPGEMTSFK